MGYVRVNIRNNSILLLRQTFDSDQFVSDIHKELVKQLGYYADSFNLIHEKEILKPYRTLQDQCVQDGDTIYLVAFKGDKYRYKAICWDCEKKNVVGLDSCHGLCLECYDKRDKRGVIPQQPQQQEVYSIDDIQRDLEKVIDETTTIDKKKFCGQSGFGGFKMYLSQNDQKQYINEKLSIRTVSSLQKILRSVKEVTKKYDRRVYSKEFEIYDISRQTQCLKSKMVNEKLTFEQALKEIQRRMRDQKQVQAKLKELLAQSNTYLNDKVKENTKWKESFKQTGDMLLQSDAKNDKLINICNKAKVECTELNIQIRNLKAEIEKYRLNQSNLKTAINLLKTDGNIAQNKLQRDLKLAEVKRLEQNKIRTKTENQLILQQKYVHKLILQNEELQKQLEGMSVKSSKNFSEGEIEEPFFDDLETWKKDYLEVNPPFVSEEEKLEEINRKQEAFDNEMKKKDKNAFEMVDKNGDKLLSKDEFYSYMKKLGFVFSPSEIDYIMAMWGDGEVMGEESFECFSQAFDPYDPKGSLFQHEGVYDDDFSGRISINLELPNSREENLLINRKNSIGYLIYKVHGIMTKSVNCEIDEIEVIRQVGEDKIELSQHMAKKIKDMFGENQRAFQLKVTKRKI